MSDNIQQKPKIVGGGGELESASIQSVVSWLCQHTDALLGRSVHCPCRTFLEEVNLRRISPSSFFRPFAFNSDAFEIGLLVVVLLDA